MNIVDSSGWLEYFAAGPNAHFFEKPIVDVKNLIVPSICIYEVCRRTLTQRDEEHATEVMAQMVEGQVIGLHEELAYSASLLSFEHRLPMADAIILATAQACNATLWTQDADFKDLPSVKYFPHKPAKK